MNSALKLQLDVKNNAQDLQNYMLDLNNWEEEMKRKESALSNEKPEENVFPPPRNKIKRSQAEQEKKCSVKPKKISAYDYSAWDKFDVDKACAEIDEEDIEEKSQKDDSYEIMKGEAIDENKNNNNDKNKMSLIDEAFYEKEMGNQFVKKEQWTEAIRCYTKAISLDSNNAIYYANRSLCFLKLKNLKSAETDATTAIQLDEKYVKAYQRRAIARLALGQLAEAKSDYVEILKLEPKNALARFEISRIDEKLKGQNVIKNEKKTFNPKHLFKQDDSKFEMKTPVKSSTKQLPPTKIANSFKPENVFPKPVPDNKSDVEIKTDKNISTPNRKNSGLEKLVSTFEKGDGDKVVPIGSGKPKSEIFKPLPEGCRLVHPVNLPPHKRSKKPLKRIDITVVNKDEDDFVKEGTKSECATENKIMNEKVILSRSNEEEDFKNEKLSFDAPKTAIQFRNCWKILKKNPEECYSYLKKIQGKELPKIFENSLESDFFSELVTFFASDELKKEPEVIYDFLLGLSKVKRFSSLTLFMSEADRNCVKKSLAKLEIFKTKEEISELLCLYELKG